MSLSPDQKYIVLQAFREDVIFQSPARSQTKIRQLYRHFLKHQQDLRTLAQRYCKQSPSEAQYINITPVQKCYRYYQKILALKDSKTADPTAFKNNTRYQLQLPHPGVLFIVIKTAHPVLYVFLSLLNLLIHKNSAVIFLDHSCSEITQTLRQIITPVIPEKEILLLDKTDCRPEDFKSLSIETPLTITDTLSGASFLTGQLHFTFLDEELPLPSALSYIYAHTVMNAGATFFRPHALFTPESTCLRRARKLHCLQSASQTDNMPELQSHYNYVLAQEQIQFLKKDPHIEWIAEAAFHTEKERYFMKPAILIHHHYHLLAHPMLQHLRGPVLHLFPYQNLEHLSAQLHKVPGPFNWSIFSKNKRHTDWLIRKTKAQYYFINNIYEGYCNALFDAFAGSFSPAQTMFFFNKKLYVQKRNKTLLHPPLFR